MSAIGGTQIKRNEWKNGDDDDYDDGGGGISSSKAKRNSV